MPISPTAEGFRAAFRRPLLTFAEITWRWVVGATAVALLLFGFFEYLDTLPVTNGDLLFLKTREPFFVGQAFAHILRGGLKRGVLALLLATLLIALIWIVIASVGRFATLEAMIGYFRTRFHAAGIRESGLEGHASEADLRACLVPLMRLNFLRVSLALGAFVGLVGSAIVAGSVSSAHANPGLEFLLFVPMVLLVCLIWYVLNWLLSLASVYAVRDREDAVDAISSAVTLVRERTGAVLAVSTWTGTAHLIVFAGASTVVSLPLALAQILPWRLVVLGALVLSLVYFAVADWLYTARLAGYVCIAEMPDDALLVTALPLLPLAPSIPAATIDRDELILSDVPNAPVET